MNAARRGVDGPPRLLCIDKPAGPSSFQVVRRVRRITEYRRVGHGGTLDPFATGLLVVGLGAATRLLRFVTEGEKTYEAEVEFGFETDTEDRTGRIVRRSAHLPAAVDVEAVLGEFVGTIEQVPPAISAVHVQGERSYRRARRGEDVELAAREVRVEAFDLIDFEAPRARLRIRCGSGTYIRALARDLGRRLDSAACVNELRRTQSGPFRVGDAHGLEDLEAAWPAGERGIGPEVLVRDWPTHRLGPEEVGRVRQGRQPDPDWWGAADWRTLPERVALVDPEGSLVAIAMREGAGPLRLTLVLPEAG